MDDQATIAIITLLKQEASELRYGKRANLDGLLRRTEVVLRRTFGSESTHLQELKSLTFAPEIAPSTEEYEKLRWKQDQERLENILSAAGIELLIFGDEKAGKSATGHETTPSNTVFIVHGRDSSMLDRVARLIEKLELKPIILHELPNEGRTIIEKFERFTDVGFAVILLTSDDIGYLKAEGQANARPRPRQNVILELGFFLGRLGRRRVAVLHPEDENLEMPSDYAGVLYIPVDSPGKWQFRLANELKAAGLRIDANRIL